MSKLVWLRKGTVTSPKGFLATGMHAGIKPGREKDLALVVSAKPAEAAGAFTTNQVKAGPVRVCQAHIKNGPIKAVILNSGNANACTGVRGIADAKRMTVETANVLKCRPHQVLVCSTGRIGRLLPIRKVLRGIRSIAGKVKPNGGTVAARAIMTSDTRRKEAAVRLTIAGRRLTIGAMAKGAGMIHPNMATMLCVVTTDAAVDKRTLVRLTADAVEHSFNRISVDGDMSTNDTVLVLANGAAGNTTLKSYDPDLGKFSNALKQLMLEMAKKIVEDGEGKTRVIELRVCGAATERDARMMAEAIVRSPLVKTSWAGGDPNWGRIMGAIGACGARMREELVDIHYDGVSAVRGGVAAVTPPGRLKAAARRARVSIQVDLNLGKGEYRILTTDLSEKYVRI
ncbi:MAG: bifunctional glutamate N-acetyltransferase/amino-acid acetyltransferase ArgJ, partial [Candidatus Methylacidiphilales bacterium]